MSIFLCLFYIFIISLAYLIIGMIVMALAEKKSDTILNNWKIEIFLWFIWPIVFIFLGIGRIVSFIRWIKESKKDFIKIIKEFCK